MRGGRGSSAAHLDLCAHKYSDWSAPAARYLFSDINNVIHKVSYISINYLVLSNSPVLFDIECRNEFVSRILARPVIGSL